MTKCAYCDFKASAESISKKIYHLSGEYLSGMMLMVGDSDFDINWAGVEVTNLTNLLRLQIDQRISDADALVRDTYDKSANRRLCSDCGGGELVDIDREVRDV